MRSLLYILIFLSGLILFVLSKRAKRQGHIGSTQNKKEKIGGLFDQMAHYVYEVIFVRFLSVCGKSLFLQSVMQAPQVKRDLCALYPGNTKELEKTYYIRKLKLLMAVLYVGDLVVLCVHLSSLGTGLISRDGVIRKNDYGKGEKYVNVRVGTEGGEFKQNLCLVIDEKIYTDEELEIFFGRIIPQLEQKILGENENTQNIKSNLILPTGLQGYPFKLEWKSSDYFLMDHKGRIIESEIDEKGQNLTLTCRFLYRDWEKEYSIPLLLFPTEKSGQEIWEEGILSVIRESEEKQKYEEIYALPESMNGEGLVWEEHREDTSMSLLAFVLLGGCLIYILQDRELHRQTEERSRQMLAEYPIVINRLTLYLGAGMTIKSAFCKIAMDYREKKKEHEKSYVYEEMLFACYEMQSGVVERKAYERFGRRLGLQPYTRLVGFLNQSLQKGNAALLEDLQKEAEEAQEERRNQARKKGEEAGTKLLMPMMLMLGIVMVLVMLPAFLSFSL